jgi:hypothetical protein
VIKCVYFHFFILKNTKKRLKKHQQKSLIHLLSKDKLREEFIGAWPGTDGLIGNALSLAFAKLPACMCKEPGGGLKHVVSFV